MQIYLPIAGMPIDIIVILLLGCVVGLFSGMFGIGGGFLATPFLIFIGVPPAIAVSSSANQTIASSMSGILSHYRRNNIDFKMAFFLLIGGFFGSIIGVSIFVYLKKIGQIDLVISVTYVLFLGTIGILMGIESFKVIWQKKHDNYDESKEIRIKYFRELNLPLKTEFPRSNIELSAILPIGLGFFTSILVAIMGIGGGFIMVPAMIYILGMPTTVVVGTSLMQLLFIASFVTFQYAINTYTVDVVLSFFLVLGSAFGAQYGTKIGLRIAPEILRASLSCLIMIVVLKLAWGLFVRPTDIYEIILLDYQ